MYKDFRNRKTSEEIIFVCHINIGWPVLDWKDFSKKRP